MLKHQLIIVKVDLKKDIIAIILGRKGSKGIPNKNIMKILGKPAYHYPFQAAKKSKFYNFWLIFCKNG